MFHFTPASQLDQPVALITAYLGLFTSPFLHTLPTLVSFYLGPDRSKMLRVLCVFVVDWILRPDAGVLTSDLGPPTSDLGRPTPFILILPLSHRRLPAETRGRRRHPLPAVRWWSEAPLFLKPRTAAVAGN